jgi:hypothetical protein
MLTKNQIKKMQSLFPFGWTENDIPAIWRLKESVKEQSEVMELVAQERAAEQLGSLVNPGEKLRRQERLREIMLENKIK